MSWWAIDVRPPVGQEDSVGAWLVGRTGQAVEERSDGTLTAFTADEAAADALVEQVGRELTASIGSGPRLIEQVDWSTRWREGLGPRTVERLTIVPSWLPEAAVSDPFTIVLDPETAFGSGEHGSTRVALTLLSRTLQPGARVLDLGSGSGILAIAAIKLGAARAIGIDVDAEANEVAVRNASRNGVAEKVEFIEGDAAVLSPLAGPADLLLSNILRTVNTALLPVIATALAPGGMAVFSGMEQPESDDFRRALSDARFVAIQEAVDSGWWGVAATLEP
jgi:ribosomal protein L11 methyltransferase